MTDTSPVTSKTRRARFLVLAAATGPVLAGVTGCGPTSATAALSSAQSWGSSASADVSAAQSGASAATSSTRPGPSGADPATPTPAPTGPTAPGRLHVVHAPETVLDDMHLSPAQCHLHTAANGQPLPDPACTPGGIDPAVNQSNIKTTICRPGYTATVRPAASDTDAWKRASQADYGVGSGGEYDHLVSLELGGTNATSNLWPEPGTIPNPKDAVENRLHKEVCDGQITLAAAQQAIATNWTTTP